MPEAGSTPPLPAYFRLAAPASWQAVDLISDLHLCEAMPRTFEAFSDHLLGTSADAVFILGDLFEAWVGDDMGSRGFERRCVEVMAQAASLRQIGFMVGNRDFLAGAMLLRQSGAMGLPDPTLFDAWGQPVLLSHGDALCLDDAPYQAFRRQVRSAQWQADFLARPLAERLQIAADIRHASQTRRQFDGAADADADTAEAVHWMHAMGARELVHGHTHRPGSNALAPGYKRHVLSDWDLDQGTRAEVLRLTRDGFVRLPPATR
jgi:UDP-2,3-diacylglucosamine hydrolase